MYTRQQPFFLIAQTPVHPGSGSDLGVIDLPIQRERHTGFPKIEASGIKGVFREAYSDRTIMKKEILDIVFGPDQGDGHQSAVGFVDARILFFPVKSVKGSFAWVTCLDVLAKFQEILNFADVKIKDEDGAINLCSSDLIENCITENSVISVQNNHATSVVLEEYPATVTENPLLTRFATWFSGHVLQDGALVYQKEKLKTSMVVLSAEMFTKFVKYSTEVIARTRIDSETGTVKTGALWYEEYLPVETILYSTVLASQPMMSSGDLTVKVKDLEEKDREKGLCLDKNPDGVMELVTQNFPSIIQIGGNATIGKGFMRPVLLETGEVAHAG